MADADDAMLGQASWDDARQSYNCPRCSGGAVPDWEHKAPLRCTGCKLPLAPYGRLRVG